MLGAQAKRLAAARRVFKLMFQEDAPSNRSIEQLRGIEGSKVRELYGALARKNGIQWHGRDQKKALDDPLNRAISGANAALYGVTEAIVLALGYSPAIGFVHSGDPRSFVFDVADTIKFKTVIPLAMELYANGAIKNESDIRTKCRDLFKDKDLTRWIVENISGILGHHKIDG